MSLFVRARIARAIAPLLLMLALGCAAQTTELTDLDRFPRTTLRIQSGKTLHTFKVWVADTPARQEQGLMFVRDLPADCGMIFPQSEPRPMSMWMKNTFIPLDMLFIGADGRIEKIAVMTEPHSLETISASQPVAAVLELKGGETQRRGIKVDDKVSSRHPAVIGWVSTKSVKPPLE